MPRGTKFKAEQVIGKLREAEVDLARGKTVPEAVRKLGLPEQTSAGSRVQKSADGPGEAASGGRACA
jgi:hypothetical protein